MHHFATLLLTFVSMGSIASLGAAEEAGDPLKDLGEGTAVVRATASASVLGLSGSSVTDAAATAAASPSSGSGGSVLDAMKESLFGDVYADPSRWCELSASTFFSQGWNKPWVSPPPGEGGAPRQGWLNAFDGVFYRLAVATTGYAEGFHNNGNQYTGGVTLYTPFNERFELQYDVPFIVSNREATGSGYEANFGDFQVTPRFLISETRNVTQSFNLTFRTPTGDTSNGNAFAAVTPTYQFWANPWRALVLRGGAGLSVPYYNLATGARTSFIANFAAGYYCTPHDLTPFGDLVAYLSANLNQPTDNRAGPRNTTVTLTPGFRTHLGGNWYLLGGVEVPVTRPRTFDYQVLGGLMRVF